MKLFTGNFRRCGKHPQAVAISVGVPRWYKGKRMLALAPTRPMLKLNEPDYRKVYAEQILAHLSPKGVVAGLKDGDVLLCWEKDGDFCHRHIVADWLREQGHEVEEYTSVHRGNKPATPGLFDPPPKGD